MKSLVRSATVLVAVALGSVAACSVADIPGSGVAARPVEESVGACVDGGGRALEEVDASALAPCECKAGGKARCVPKAKLPETLSKQLDACEGETGACVPDSIVASRGAPPPTCKTLGADVVPGVEGRCVSLCVPKVAKFADQTSRGEGNACAEDERCIPCTMPDGARSGVCEIGAAACGTSDAGPATRPPATCPFTGVEMNLARFPECAPGGHCVPRTLLEEAVQDAKTRAELEVRLATCDAGFCVPDEYLKKYGQHKPTACTSFAGIEGRCFSTVFKDVGAQKDLLSQDTCTPNERCIPCFNPADGAPTGACTTVSCDASTKAPPTLKDCCPRFGQMRGKCVPKDDVPEQFQTRLLRQQCGVPELCVPTENINLKAVPKPCTPRDGGQGVCASTCIRFRLLENVLLEQAECAPEQTCVPCVHPRTKEPTGAPGCK